jgi:hypothetical protein
MTTHTSEQFADELRSYFTMTLLNLVFGAMAMAFGMQFIVTSVLSFEHAGIEAALEIPLFLVGVIAVIFGIRWIVFSARMLKGIAPLKREYRKMEKPLSEEILTSMIIRLITHYRENQWVIRRMTIICTLAGCIFLVLGILNLIQGILAGPFLTLFLNIFAAGINLVIGSVALISSSWFRHYAAVWDQRLETVFRSQETLQHAMDEE